MENEVEVMKKCPAFHRCNCNLCPLDYKLYKRRPKGEGKCRYMREPKCGQKTVIFTSGPFGSKKKVTYTSKPTQMPSALLKHVPACNVESLNSASREAWHNLMNNSSKFNNDYENGRRIHNGSK